MTYEASAVGNAPMADGVVERAGIVRPANLRKVDAFGLALATIDRPPSAVVQPEGSSLRFLYGSSKKAARGKTSSWLDTCRLWRIVDDVAERAQRAREAVPEPR